MQQWGLENGGAMTFDEASMERSKSFVKALQELKNLRPQLYSAAEYCEKSYLHSEQKQMVLDNLKDYGVRALVNAVDHLGTVAYKLTDLFEQQALDISTVELKIACLGQQLLTCKTYTDKEGLRQQLLSGTIARHHKHYILPNCTSNRVENSSKLQDDSLRNLIAKHRDHTTGVPASKTLSWHLATETNSASDETPDSTFRVKDFKFYKMTSEVFHLLEAEEPSPKPLSSHLQTTNQRPSFDFASHTSDVKDTIEVSKPPSTFTSLDNSGRREICRPPARNKSMLSAFFPKNKTFKPNRVPVS